MSRQQWLAIIGVWIMVFQKLGFPSYLNEPFAICTGLLIIFISFKVTGKGALKNKSQSAYVENSK